MPKPDGVVFPYGIKLKETGEAELFPAAKIELHRAKNETVTFFFLIDSGATLSALPASDAQTLNIDLKKGKPITVTGIGTGHTRGTVCSVQAKIGGRTIHIPVAFLQNERAPRVLGREGVFTKFTIIFEETSRRTTFLTKNSTKAAKIKKITDTLDKN